MTITILDNGIIHTLNPRQPRAEALAIRGERIVAVGSTAQVRAAVGTAHSEHIDLGGRAVIPGLTDAHVHLTWYGLSLRQVRLGDVGSLEAAVERVAAWAQGVAAGAWLRGSGWDHEAWPSRWPHRADLDRVCPDNPVMLMRKDGHSVWLNSRALVLANIGRDTPDPPGGHIQRDAAGEPTGILLEAAQDLARHAAGAPTPDERRAALRDVLREALRYGMTSVHIPPGPNSDDGHETLTDLQILYKRGELPLRCLAHIAARDLDAALALGLRSGLGDHWLRVGGIKIFADGSLGSTTAEMLEPYEDSDERGMAVLPVEELNDLVQRANQHGISVTVHAIGDRANRKVLDAIARARAQHNPHPPVLPNRIEHAQCMHPADIARFVELDVIASMQPLHATSDMLMADKLWGDRCATSYALRAFLEAGVTLALGSDAPVEAFNPWLGMHAAVTRQRVDGTPPQGWYPAQRIELDAALRGYCSGPAVASGEAHDKGMLAPGMLADLAVLTADPFVLPPAQLHRVAAVLTMVGGQVRWEQAAAQPQSASSR